MGSDKAQMMFCGKSLLERATSLLSRLPVNDIVVLGREGVDHGVRDEIPYTGPARAIKTWLGHRPKPLNLLVIPVDMPALAPAQLNHLLDQPSGAFYRDLYLPFFAPYALQGRLASNTARMRDVISAFKLTELSVPPHWRNALTNVNTPDDLHALEQTFKD